VFYVHAIESGAEFARDDSRQIDIDALCQGGAAFRVAFRPNQTTRFHLLAFPFFAAFGPFGAGR